MGWEDHQIDSPLLLSHLIVDSTVDPQFTGLLSPKGEPIFRFPIPIGFGRDNEW